MRTREAIMNDLYAASFALDDVVLYLDTHPLDQEALEYYHEVQALEDKITEEYLLSRQGELMNSTVDNCKCWTWINNPWPWEGVY